MKETPLSFLKKHSTEHGYPYYINYCRKCGDKLNKHIPNNAKELHLCEKCISEIPIGSLKEME